MAKNFELPDIDMSISWGPTSSKTLYGDMKSGIAVVFLTCSPMPLVLSINDGKCVVPRTVFPVEDCGRVVGEMVVKMGILGNSPNATSSDVVVSMLHNISKPVTFMATVSMPLHELCVDNKTTKLVTTSLENPDVTFHVSILSRYVPSPAQTMLVQMLSSPGRKTVDQLRLDLQNCSNERVQKILTFLETNVGSSAATECAKGLVRCPQESWNSMGAMDPTQMTELNMQYTKVMRDRFMLILVAAAQQSLSGMGVEHHERAIKETTSLRMMGFQNLNPTMDLMRVAHFMCATPETRAALRSTMQTHIEEWVACNSCYTYDACMNTFALQNKHDLSTAIPTLSSMYGNHHIPYTQKHKHPRGKCVNCNQNFGVLFDGVVGNGGESQNLAGLINVGTLHVRRSLMRSVKANITSQGKKISDCDVSAVMRESDRMQNASLMLGDCEDMAFENTAAMQAVLMYESEVEFDHDIDKTMRAILPHDQSSHEAIKHVLHGYRAACLEANPCHFTATSLVYARGANLSDQTLSVNENDAPKTMRALKTDFETSKNSGMAGHAVCTNFEITPPKFVDGLCVTEILNWQTREGTADTILLPLKSREQVQLSFHTTDPELQKYSGRNLNSCFGHNVMAKYLAHKSTETCQAQFPDSKLTFCPQQACDPGDNVSSFYRYAIAFGSFYVFTHENGLSGLLESKKNISENIVGFSRPSQPMLQCASMVLGQQRQQGLDDVPESRPIGITVPISASERDMISALAWTHRALYPTLDNLLVSAQETNFYLMPTVVAGHRVEGVKCNTFLRATTGDVETELRARAQIAQVLGADAVRHLNSHMFSLTWKF